MRVLVRVRTAGVNPADIVLRDGVMDHAYDALFPVIPGLDMAGIVEKAGLGAPEFSPGGEVIGYRRGQVLRYGTYAERASADVHMLVRSQAT
ncbi:alcohol dehydrogenase catalytic domain-containing protein [Streptomyces sp. NPDC086519]|uniref:alcohol dehydrogenase catalytic domain-containing protein n=1 Tax=Streptomyces sp. NPDC086519 TaxID=3154863 RepID=UPI003424EC5E